MKRRLFNGEAIISIDPNDVWKDATPTEMFEWCGFLPGWVLDYPQEPQADTIKEHLEKCYGFGRLHPMSGGVVNDKQQYDYPEDPLLEPFLFIELVGGEQFIQWSYGICAFRDSAKDEWFVTRMD